MFDSLRNLLAPPVFPNEEEKTRAAELLNTVLLMLTTLAAIAILAFVLGGTVVALAYFIVGTFLTLLIILQIPMRRGYVRPVGILTIIFFVMTITLTLARGGTVRAPGLVLLVAPIIMSGLILGRRAATWSAVITSVIYIILQWLEVNGRLPAPNLTLTIQQPIIFGMNSALVAILLGIALRRINESLERARLGEEKLSTLNVELEKRVEERTAELAESTKQIRKRASQLEAIANTARSAATARSLDDLLSAFTKDISARFGFYHIGIFLLDANKEFAILRASNSEGGQNLLARGHRLRVGEQGIVGYTTYSGNPRIALDVGADAVFFNNPDLPATRSEIALPLKFGQEIIGALDIQSKESNAFSRDDVEIFSTLAYQVSVAIQNARSLDQAQRALQEAEIATSQLTGNAWKGYIEKISTRGYRYDGIKPEPLRNSTAEDKNTVSIPVQLRGQTIGRLKLRASSPSHTWSEDELAIIESTAGRVALAIDSARLLDEAQKRATRESFLSEIGAKLGTSFQLDSILRDTVEELGQTLKGSKVSFQLVNPSAPSLEAGANDTSASQEESE